MTYGEMTAGMMPELHFAQREHAVVGGDDDVADRHQADAAAKCRARGRAPRPAWAAYPAARACARGLRRRSGSRGACRQSPSTSTPGRRRSRTPCPAPAMTTARSVASAAARAAAAVRSAIIPSSKAFRTSGRLSVRRRTGPSRSTRIEGIVSLLLSGHRPAPTSGTRRTSISGIGALKAAESPSASAFRVSAGSRIPSSHSLAVE